MKKLLLAAVAALGVNALAAQPAAAQRGWRGEPSAESNEQRSRGDGERSWRRDDSGERAQEQTPPPEQPDYSAQRRGRDQDFDRAAPPPTRSPPSFTQGGRGFERQRDNAGELAGAPDRGPDVPAWNGRAPAGLPDRPVDANRGGNWDGQRNRGEERGRDTWAGNDQDGAQGGGRGEGRRRSGQWRGEDGQGAERGEGDGHRGDQTGRWRGGEQNNGGEDGRGRDWGRDDRGGDRDWNGGHRNGRDWGHDGRRDWADNDRWRGDWERNRHDQRYRPYWNTHRDFSNPRFHDWRRIRYGYFFDYGYARIISRYYGRDYYWWSYDGWHRPHRPWRVGYVIPAWLWWEPLPWDLYYMLPPAPYGCRYIYADGDILLIAIASGVIIDALLYGDY